MRLTHALALLALVSSLSGCSMFLVGASLDEKRESIAAYAEHAVAGQPLHRFVRQRIALLAQGDFAPDGTFQLQSNGAAVAVSADGYYLTAAHCVDSVEAPLYLAPAPLTAFDSERLHEARVVWRATDCDLALLHADLPPRAYVSTWRRGPARRVPAIAGGFPGKAYVVLAAGEVFDVLHCRSNGAVLEVHHTAPVRRGDSGGPVFGIDGAFLGINVEGIYHWPFLELTAKALLPDEAFVQELIARDRLRGRQHGD